MTIKSPQLRYSVTGRLAAASLACALLAPGPAPAQAATENAVQPVAGAYLAGRAAGRLRDNEAAVKFFSRTLRYDPGNREILQRSLLHLVAAGDIARAIRLARRAIDYRKDDMIARVVLGLAEFRAGRHRAARGHFRQLQSRNRFQLFPVILTAWTHVAGHNTARALKVIDKLKRVGTLKGYYLFHRALIAETGRNDRLTGSYYEAAYARSKTSIRLVQAYGRFLERTGRPNRALAVYDGFLKRHPTNRLILNAIVRIKSGTRPRRLVPDGLSGAAELMFAIATEMANNTGLELPLRFTRLALYARPDFVNARQYLADIYLTTGRYAKAVKEYARVPVHSPLRRNSDINAARALDQLKKYQAARLLLKQVIARHPRDFEPVMLLADMLRDRKKYAPAIEAYSRAIDLTKPLQRRHWRLLYHRGIAYERSKIWPKAERDFKRSLQLFPDQPRVLNYLGYSWVEQRHNLDEAMAMIRKAVQLRPRDGYIIDSLGWAHYQLGEYEDAVKALEKAVKIMPSDPILNDHLGDAYWRVGRKLEARFQWAHARDLKPEPKNLETILHKLKNGLGAPKSKAKPRVGQ
jgi:tetratricopeptide (TPR) repeat protein